MARMGFFMHANWCYHKKGPPKVLIRVAQTVGTGCIADGGLDLNSRKLGQSLPISLFQQQKNRAHQLLWAPFGP